MSHVLHCGDGIAGMAAMPDRSVDHLICDPPYSEHVHGKQRRQTLPMGHGEYGPQPGSKAIRSVSLGFDHITAEQVVVAAAAFARLVRRWVIVFSDNESVPIWIDALTDAGLEHVRIGVWVKEGCTPQFTGDRPASGHESIVIAHPKGRKRWNGGGARAVWVYPIVQRHTGLREHTTQKPIELMETIVRDFTDPGDLVCDPYSGAATTGVACKRLGRRFVGWEINEKFHAAAVKRLDAAREQFQLPRMARPRQLQLEGPEKDEKETA